MRKQDRSSRAPRADSTPRSRAITIGLVVLLLIGTGGVAAARVANAVTTLRSAEDDIEAASELLKDGQIGPARDRLESAEDALAEVNETLHTAPDLTALGLVPVVRENLQSIRETIELASTVVHGGRLIIDSAGGLEGPDGTLEVSVSEGQVDVAQLEEARTQVDDLLVHLTVMSDDGGSRFLLPLTREARNAVAAEADEQRHNLERLRRGLTILDQLLGITQPSRNLIAVANTAEMRGSGGMMLNYGILDGDSGGADLVGFGRVEELPLSGAVDPESVGLPEDFVRRWEGFHPTREWRNTTLAGDFTVTAPALLGMYQRSTSIAADGVIQVDAHALAAILSVTGPVTIDEVGQVTADNVVDLVLNEAYRLFPGVEERTDVLGDVAEAAFRALVDGDYPSVRDLATTLVDAVDGRHLMMYSADPTVQSALGYYEADGSLPVPDAGDYLHLTAQNMSGNKLDYYVDTALDVRGQRIDGEIGELTVTVSVTNGAPVGETQPRYIFGPFDDDQEVGVYRSAVSLYLPTGTSVVGASGDAFRHEPALQTEAGRPVVTYWIDVPSGETHTAELQLQLAPPPTDEAYSLELVPSPRVRPTTASVDVDLGDGGRLAGDVDLDVGWLLGPQGPQSMAGY